MHLEEIARADAMQNNTRSSMPMILSNEKLKLELMSKAWNFAEL
jgi:hypothetical protein